MKETGLQGKTCVVPVAVVAVLGMAGMGLVSTSIVNADTVTDTINVTVQPSCTFNSVEDKTYVGSATNGTEVNNFNDQGIHEFNLFCNDNNGYIVTATPYDLESDIADDVIEYTNNYTHTGVKSMWTAEIASETLGVTVTSPVPVGGGTIISSDSHTVAAGASFTATYKAYVGSATPAGTYTGTIVYTLTASGASNSGNNTHANTDKNENDGETESNNGGTNSDSNNDTLTEPDSQNSGAGMSSAPSAAPLATNLNNTYSTYNTTNSYNTYNTTSYGGSGVVPAATNIAPTTTSNETDGVTSGDGAEGSSNASGVGVGSGYEKPLGVTSTTSSSSTKDSETMDPIPIVATGALAAAGIVALALARSGRKENEKE